ncbi:SMI1/KNR4 family protein [Streptomyces sp. NBC_00090]|uniref:SMI1/KNR4 family protein n=1 Tax=Streptomyces sp. NBC_00090 TaxID=2903619 RepID=UPI00324F7181
MNDHEKSMATGLPADHEKSTATGLPADQEKSTAAGLPADHERATATGGLPADHSTPTGGLPADHVAAFAALFGAPPEAPAVPVDWDAVEEWAGLRLPADYKAIATAYGPLDIGERLWLHTPFDREGGWFDYGSFVESGRRDAPGVLPFGATRMSDTLYWDTTASDDPDLWPVVVHLQDAANAGRDPWLRLGTPLLPALAGFVADGLRPVLARSGLAGDEAYAWTPPARRPEPTPEQRAALTEGSGLKALTALLPPPAAPRLGDRNWEWLYERLGTRLPTEYVRLMETYGGGGWCQWLRFGLPLGTGRYDLAPWAEWYGETYRELRDAHPRYHPLAAWPEPGGFLAFADSIDGDQLCWLTEGDDPDAWPLVVVPRHADQGPPLTGTLTGNLLAWLRGELATEGLPRLVRTGEDPLEIIEFAPFTDEPDDQDEGPAGTDSAGTGPAGTDSAGTGPAGTGSASTGSPPTAG